MVETSNDRSGDGRERRHAVRARRAVAASLLMLIGLGFALVAAGGALTHRYLDRVERITGAFAGLDPAQRPARVAGTQPDATFLLVGSDGRGDGAWAPGAQRADTLMLVHLDGHRHGAHAMSIPRDAWVAVPGHGSAKINAAYSWGGFPLLVRTVEGLTGVRIDHVAAVDFAGFAGLIDAVGGVDVDVRRATSTYGVTFPAGRNHLDGDRALAYVRQRHGLPRGDLDRVLRQQQVLQEVGAKVANGGLLTHPQRLAGLLDAVTANVSVDAGLSDGDLLRVAWGLRSLRPGDVAFGTAPVRGFGREGRQSVVYLDVPALRGLVASR